MINNKVEKKYGHKVSIVVEDAKEDGKDIITLDVLIDGKSIAESEVDYEEMYGSYSNMPQSLRFVQTVMAAIGGSVL